MSTETAAFVGDYCTAEIQGTAETGCERTGDSIHAGLRGCLRECTGDGCNLVVFGGGFCITCEEQPEPRRAAGLAYREIR
jgi:hypothetical protein